MDILTFEYDREAVVAGLRAGELDCLEPVTEGTEAEFFRDLLGRPLMDRLVENYPTPRKKEEVPIWMYLSSQISLRLHGTGSYHAFPYVLRSGGLISALGPTIERKAVHPLTKEVTLSCTGFNEKNPNDRQMPCDQDFLRKFARDRGCGSPSEMVQPGGATRSSRQPVAGCRRDPYRRRLLCLRSGQRAVRRFRCPSLRRA